MELNIRKAKLHLGLDKLEDYKNFVIFGREGCPWCVRAKRLGKLVGSADSVNYIDVTDNRDVWLQVKNQLKELFNVDIKTVPQVFVDTGSEWIYVGGCDDMHIAFSPYAKTMFTRRNYVNYN